MFDCFSDPSSCLYGACCPTCAIARVMEDNGEGSCCATVLCMTCCPLCGCFQAVKGIDNINQKWGGESACCRIALCLYCCGNCMACQLLRANEKAKAEGLVKGAPEGDVEMTR